MSSDQNYLEMRVLIQKHKENERIYKEKISEVNLTRARIHDQLEILKQSYDKKVKSLQQKLQNMKLQNQTLLRQNLLFKTQIDTYQNRLLEKEKIIVVLLNQKREAHLNGNSQKSKSDKTQSNQAMEQEKQHFKKHIPTFRDSPQDAQVGTSKFKDEILMTNKSNVEFKSQTSKLYNVKEKDTQENVSRVKKRIDIQQSQIPVQPVERSLLKEVKVQVQKNQFTEDNQQNSATNYFQSLAKSKQDQQLKVQLEVQTQVRKKPPPPKKKQTSKAVPQPRANKAKKHLKKRHANQHAQQQVPVEEEEPLPTYQTQVQGEIYHEDAYLEQQDNHIQQNLALKTHNQEIKYQQQVQIVPEQQHYQQEKEFNYAQHFGNTENIQEQQQVIETKPEQPQTNNKNQQYRQFNQEEGESYNNFLSHFNSQPQQHQNMASASISPKPIARKKKTIKKVGGFGQDQAVQQDHSMNSTDFFNQLNKHEHQVPHQLDIQQSSIDHNDRDSSLISNQPHYFTQQQTVQKAKPVKMTKKKGKRDQIKVADPSLFE